ncbi:MAG: hypothetical protein AAGH42_08750 [Pseudomonadota bacterium]
MSVAFDTHTLESAQPVLTSEEMYRRGLAASIAVSSSRLDLIEAHKWFNLAAMQGNAEARHYRAELARELSTDEMSEAQRLAREYLSTHAPRIFG